MVPPKGKRHPRLWEGGSPDWRWVGRDSTAAHRKARAAHSVLSVPDYRTLISDRCSLFFLDFRRPCIGAGMGQEMMNPYPQVAATKRGARNGDWAVAILPVAIPAISGRPSRIVGS